MGSKSKIARWVVERLPEGDTLYDVFCGGCAITEDKNKNMYEVIVETYCMSVRDYAASNAVRILFDNCYEDKTNAVKEYNDQFKKYCKEHKDCYWSKDDYSFKIVEKKSAGYNVVIRGRIIIKGEMDK